MARHIYVGLSGKKVWCGASIRRRDGSLTRPEQSPITEGEYIDGFGFRDVCPECAKACSAVRGEPNQSESRP